MASQFSPSCTAESTVIELLMRDTDAKFEQLVLHRPPVAPESVGLLIVPVPGVRPTGCRDRQHNPQIISGHPDHYAEDHAEDSDLPVPIGAVLAEFKVKEVQVPGLDGSLFVRCRLNIVVRELDQFLSHVPRTCRDNCHMPSDWSICNYQDLLPHLNRVAAHFIQERIHTPVATPSKEGLACSVIRTDSTLQ